MIRYFTVPDVFYETELSNGHVHSESSVMVLVIVLLILLLSVAFLVLLERKLLGGLQLRTRPHNVGWFGVLQTVIDRLKLLNKPSSINNKHSFSFLILIVILSYITNIYMLIVLILGGMVSIFLGVILRGNIYGKIRAFRMIILS